MKRIHIIEGIMSLIGKVGKAVGKFTRGVREEVLQANLVPVTEGQHYFEAEEELLKKDHLHQEDQLHKEEAHRLKEKEIAKQEVARQQEEILHRLKDLDPEACAQQLQERTAKFKKRNQMVHAHQEHMENKGMIIPLHRRNQQPIRGKALAHQGKVLYLHQREPTQQEAVAHHANTDYNKKRGTGT